MNKKSADKIVSEFYKNFGWSETNNITNDAKRWEDLRACSVDYVRKCRLRLMPHIPKKGENILDMASGPIQYKEYLDYSSNFKKRYCVDFSIKALNKAKSKIGGHGVFLPGDFFDMEFENNFFDCSISLHTIYHISKDKQEEAVRKLLKTTKKGRPIIIVYSNPNTIINYLLSPYTFLKKILKKFKIITQKEDLYFYCFPIKWWYRFRKEAKIEIKPWRSFTANQQKLIFPNNKIGKAMLNILFKLETKFPDFFAKYFEYPMIVLTKK